VQPAHDEALLPARQLDRPAVILGGLEVAAGAAFGGREHEAAHHPRRVGGQAAPRVVFGLGRPVLVEPDLGERLEAAAGSFCDASSAWRSARSRRPASAWIRASAMWASGFVGS
jgi:hypothetical protein